jgi:hypothetical protein
LLWKLRALFAQADTRTFALDAVKTVITALGLIATFIAGIGLFVNYWSSEKNIQLTQERLVTERFSKAIEQLGSSNDVVVLGGIYSLGRIAKDSPKDQREIMEVLSAFVRKKSLNNTIESIKAEHLKLTESYFENNPVKITIQAALIVIKRRNKFNDKTHSDFIDLSNADLSYANLSNANLRNADLNNADLNNANLTNANLTNADLNNANLTNVILNGANLDGSNLTNLNSYTKLTPAQIKTACNWDKAKYDYRVKIDKLKQDKASEPKEVIDCSRWKSKN